MCGNERFNVSLVTCTILFYACGSWLSTRICSYYFDARKLILVSYIVYIRFAEAFHTRLLPGFRGKLVLETRNFLPGYVKSNLIIKVVIPKHSHGYVIPESRAFYFVYHPAKLFISTRSLSLEGTHFLPCCALAKIRKTFYSYQICTYRTKTSAGREGWGRLVLKTMSKSFKKVRHLHEPMIRLSRNA